MSLLGAVGKLFSSLIKKIFSFLKKIFKSIWPLLLIVAAIYFAPVVAGYLSSVGAPSFLTSIFSAASSLTPTITSAASWVWSNIGSVASTAWSGFKSLDIGTQLAVVGGAAALIAPEETAEVVEEIGTAAGTVLGAVGSAVGDVVSGIFSSPWGIAALGFAAYWFFGRGKPTADSQTIVVAGGTAENDDKYSSGYVPNLEGVQYGRVI